MSYIWEHPNPMPNATLTLDLVAKFVQLYATRMPFACFASCFPVIASIMNKAPCVLYFFTKTYFKIVRIKITKW